MLRKILSFIVLIISAEVVLVAQDAKPTQTYVGEGISVAFSASPAKADVTTLRAGTDTIVRFKITNINGGEGLSGLRPAAWIDRRESLQPSDSRACREKVQSFLQSGLSKRPTIDLNSYFILALNNEPNISVIDPLPGVGGNKLYSLVPLAASGEDWVMSADQKRIYVSLPSVNQVAVVDTLTWKVIANVDAGVNPARLALQPDGRNLWVGNDGAERSTSGVTVIDMATLKIAARLNTGLGHHEIAFNEKNALALVTNKQDGTISVIDISKLAMLTIVKTGLQPAAIVFSSLENAFYIANEGDGEIVVLSSSGGEIKARLKVKQGIGMLRMSPDGRFGFVVNKATNTVYIFDVAANKLVHSLPVGAEADQIAFTREFAYVRSAGIEFVSMIKLAELGSEVAVQRVPAGQRAPRESPARSLAAAIVPAPEGGAVLVANAADKMIYYYSEGMAAPMGSFQNYKRDPKALLVRDNGLREVAPGEYTTTVRNSPAGRHDVVFLLDSPRVVTCFDLEIAENTELQKSATVAITIEPLPDNASLRVGENNRLRFKVIDSVSGQPKPNLSDVGFLVFLAPGIWQQRGSATALGEGIYEFNFVPPRPGVYYVHFRSPSLNVQFNQIKPLTLQTSK